jgi:hypothetical protein
MQHWEVSWSTLRPLIDEEVERCVAAVSRLGCSLPNLLVETLDGRYVAVRHRENDELLLEFGFADAAPSAFDAASGRGLIERGQIVWNWCCTGRRQPETGLIVHKFRQLQQITGDKLLVWDDDGMSHWSWGSCRLEEAGVDPHSVIDAHLKHAPPQTLRRAS